jgi:hypothetical protein
LKNKKNWYLSQNIVGLLSLVTNLSSLILHPKKNLKNQRKDNTDLARDPDDNH